MGREGIFNEIDIVEPFLLVHRINSIPVFVIDLVEFIFRNDIVETLFIFLEIRHFLNLSYFMYFRLKLWWVGVIYFVLFKRLVILSSLNVELFNFENFRKGLNLRLLHLLCRFGILLLNFRLFQLLLEQRFLFSAHTTILLLCQLLKFTKSTSL